MTTLAAVGTLATAIMGAAVPILGAVTTAGVPAAVGGLLGASNKYLSTRRSIMQKHPMAYLYQLQG